MKRQQKQTFRTVTGRSGDGTASIVISTIDVDREQDVLVPEGAVLNNYLKNPVVLWGHDHRSVPIGTCTSLEVVAGKGLRAVWRWLENDPLASRVQNAFEQGIVRAASVGFMPLTYQPNEHGGYNFSSWELLEFSLVSIPANPAAVRTLKRLGLDVDPEITRASAVLKELGELLRAGHPLSVRDMARLQAASTLLTETRDELETRDEDDDDGDMTITIDGQDVRLTQATLDAAVKQIVHDEVCKAVGRVPDPLVEFEPEDDDDLIELDEESIVSLVGDAVREHLRTLMGRVD